MKIGKGDAISIADLFKDELQYRIPRYQRRYIWDQTNWKVLWEDITQFLYVEEEHVNKKHFTGTIVTLPDKNQIDETENSLPTENFRHLDVHEIIDGQQRLTTFQVIFCAIRDIATSEEYSVPHLADKIESYVVLDQYDIGLERTWIEQIAHNDTKDNAENEFSPYRFVPKGYDRDIFQSVVESKTSGTSGSILDAYEYFKKVITNYLESENSSLENLTDVLLNNFHVVKIELDRGDDPEKIFESINDTGRSLDEFDYLWNHLFLRTRKLGKRESDILYNQYWKKFEDTPFWDSAKRRDMFFRAFLMAKRGPKCLANEEKGIKAFDLYREYSKTLPGNPQLSVKYELDQLSCYADSYQDMYDSDLDSGTSILRQFGIQMQFDPLNLPCLDSFILFLKHELELTTEHLSDVFEILKSYIVRRILCATRNEDIYEEINASFSTLIETRSRDFIALHILNSLEASWPKTDDLVKKALEQAWSKDNNLILYILYELEIHKGQDPSMLGLEDLQGLGRIVSPNFYSDYHALDSIGNLMPLKLDPEGYPDNSRFDNEKKELLKYYAADLILTEEVCNQSCWNAKEIHERTQDLLSCFDQIWKSWNQLSKDQNWKPSDRP